MSVTTPAVERALGFLTLLYGDDAPGYLPIWELPGKRTKWLEASNLEAIAERSIDLAAEHDVYFGIGLHRQALDGDHRGEADTVSAIPGVWVDLDFGTVGHKSTKNPPTLQDALAIVRAFPLSPAAIVHTGHGLHGWWPFRDLWTFDTDDERQTAQHLVHRFQATLQKRAQALGYEVDSTFNVAQVLRLPATWNRKAEPIEVHLIEWHPERRYSPDELEPYLIDLEAWEKAKPVELPSELPKVDVDSLKVAPWIKDLIRQGGDSEHYKSSSEALWRIERELIEAKYDDAAIAAVILCPENKGGEKAQRQGQNWLAKDLGRARVWKPENVINIGDAIHKTGGSIGARANGQNPNGKVHDGSAEPSKLPDIIVSNRPLRDVTRDAMEAIIVANDPPSTFVRSGAITRVREDELGQPIIEPLGESHLRGVMARTADYYRRGIDKKTNAATYSHVPPPIDVVKDALALASWDLPPLEAVVESPTLRANGSILAIPGYDPETRLVYHPATRLTVSAVPECPTSNDIARARDWIEEAIGEFPYADEASKANAVGTMLTPILRPALRGHTPLALFDKPRAGTGSSLLADAIALIATGRAAGMMTAPRREEEWKKSILAILVNGSTVITIDNIEHQLVSASLASAITTHYVEDRVLGQTAMVRAPQRATWIATGNNIRLGGDLPRRCYWVRMDAKSARPWERTGFRHADLAGWVLEHRGELLGALLTLARGWYAAGKPAAVVPVMGSFEEWSKTVGGVLEHAGIHGFLGNLSELWDQADESAAQWEVFLLRWHAEFADRPVTVADICTAIDSKDREGQSIRDLLPDELAEAAGDAVFGSDNEIKPPKTGFRRQLGRALERRADTIYGDHQIVRNGKHSNTKAGLWKVVAVSLAVSPVEGELPL